MFVYDRDAGGKRSHGRCWQRAQPRVERALPFAVLGDPGASADHVGAVLAEEVQCQLHGLHALKGLVYQSETLALTSPDDSHGQASDSEVELSFKIDIGSPDCSISPPKLTQCIAEVISSLVVPTFGRRDVDRRRAATFQSWKRILAALSRGLEEQVYDWIDLLPC